jgi:chromosome segregation ATPase
MSTDVWARVDEAIDTDPLLLRGIVAEVLARAEHAEGELSSLRDHRARWQTEHERAERLAAELKQEEHHFAQLGELYVHACRGASERKSLRLRAEQAEAEVERLRAELASVQAYSRGVAEDYNAAADERGNAETEREHWKARAEQAEAEVERLRGEQAEAEVERLRGEQAEAEILAARNRVAGLEANGAELLERVERAEAERDALKAERECTQQFLRTLVYTADVLAILDAPESHAPGRTGADAATDAHGGAGEAQEAAQ